METMLYRYLGSSEKQGWSLDAKADFFRKAAALDEPQAGNFTWQTVKTLVIETQATRLVKEQSNEVVAESLPLGVWVTRGWDAEHVKQFPAEQDDKLGQLYAVPIKSTTMKDARQLIEEQLNKKEKEAVGSKRTHQNTDGEQQKKEDWDIVPHQVATRSEEPKAKKAKSQGNLSAAAKAKAEKSFQRESNKANKANEQLTLLASKATGTLARILKASGSLLQQVEKAQVGTAESVEALRNSVERGQAWNKACVDALPLATAARGTGARLQALPFTAKDLQDYTKATAALQKELREPLKALKPQKAPEAKASEAQEAKEG